MRTIRVFLNAALQTGLELELGGDEAHYLRNVLRIDRGTSLQVFNGDGNEYTADVIEAAKRRFLIGVREALPEDDATSPLSISLGLGLSRGERMDWAIQKATELGVSEITPLLLERCNAKLDEKRAENRIRHWQQIMISACEQSGRRTLVTINEPQPLAQWIDTNQSVLRLVLDPHNNEPLAQAEAPNSVALLIGPEGGLTDGEVNVALDHGFRRWRLGPRVLRTETAPAAAIAILQYQWGDL